MPPVNSEPIQRAPALSMASGVGAEYLGDAEIGPDLLDFDYRLMPAGDVCRQNAGRHGAGRGTRR